MGLEVPTPRQTIKAGQPPIVLASSALTHDLRLAALHPLGGGEVVRPILVRGVDGGVRGTTAAHRGNWFWRAGDLGLTIIQAHLGQFNGPTHVIHPHESRRLALILAQTLDQLMSMAGLDGGANQVPIGLDAGVVALDHDGLDVPQVRVEVGVLLAASSNERVALAIEFVGLVKPRGLLANSLGDLSFSRANWCG